MKKEKIVVYSPDRLIQIGFLNVWREMLLSLFQSRELIWRLFLRDFSAKYRQTLFGFLWAVINPVIVVGVFILLNKSGILNIGETTVPYPLYALIGISLYSIFSTGLSAAANSIIGAGPMVVKINFPKISLVISSFGQALVEFAVRIVLIAAVFVIFGIIPKWTTILLPLAIVPIILFTFGIGFVLSLLAGIFRDTPNITSLFTTFLLFLTPVLYQPPKAGTFVILNALNPLNHLITGCRDLILLGGINNVFGFLCSTVFAIILFLFSWRVFHLAETRIAERI
jgi:lipopolysaccharide transport system permease protein